MAAATELDRVARLEATLDELAKVVMKQGQLLQRLLGDEPLPAAPGALSGRLLIIDYLRNAGRRVKLFTLDGPRGGHPDNEGILEPRQFEGEELAYCEWESLRPARYLVSHDELLTRLESYFRESRIVEIKRGEQTFFDMR